jgi:hypothetical protein
MFDSLLRRRHNRPIPERFWNQLGTENRQELLAQEGFSGEHAQRLCAKPWKNLSIAERAWLFSPLLLMEMTSLELGTGKVQGGAERTGESARGIPQQRQFGAKLEVPDGLLKDPVLHHTRMVVEGSGSGVPVVQAPADRPLVTQTEL